jgi:hypothetical protein
MTFLNPYHFVPLPKKEQHEEHLRTKYVERGEAAAVLKPQPDQQVQPGQNQKLAKLSHDHYGAGLLSGRIVCKLTTVSPCVFGNVHKDRNQPNGEAKGVGTAPDAKDRWSAQVFNFSLDGEPAIAATTLRGCLSNLVEALSGSSMRVLVPRGLSLRSNPSIDPDQLRAAIGMIVGTRGNRRVLPLTFPRLMIASWQPCLNLKVFRSHHSDHSYGEPLEVWHALFTRLIQPSDGFLPLALGIYIDNYDTQRNPKGNRKPHNMKNPTGVLRTINPKSFGYDDRGSLWKIKAARLSFWYDSTTQCISVTGSSGQNVSSEIHWRGSLPLTQLPKDGASLAPITPGEDFQDLQDQGFRIGIIRRLEPPRKGQPKVPGDKKHELFIPIEHHLDSGAWQDCGDAIPSAEDACAAFEMNAETRGALHKDDRPQRLLGMPHGKLELRHGDLVHFRLKPELDNGNPIVESLAISAIWREDAGELFDYFGKCGLRELLPFTSSRDKISPAEQIFGFVQQDPMNENDTRPGRCLTAYAGRVRFSAARHVAGAKLKDVEMKSQFSAVNLGLSPGCENDGWFPLRILASPKLPCPEFYFCDDAGNYILRRSRPRPDGKARPQGWKIYLHDPLAIRGQEMNGRFTWQTEKQADNRNQKMLVRPIPSGQDFFFHIDFDNLDDCDLGLLLRALEPVSNFHHKLGLGKPVGLGSVKITLQGVFLINRQLRYAEAQSFLSGRSPRYHSILTPGGRPPADLAQWPARYKQERIAIDRIETHSWGDTKTYQDKVSPPEEVSRALDIFGNPTHVTDLLDKNPAPEVSYPYIFDPKNNFDREDKLFEWFSRYIVRSKKPAGLRPVKANGDGSLLEHHILPG